MKRLQMALALVAMLFGLSVSAQAAEKTILNVNKNGLTFSVRAFQAGKAWKARLVLYNHTKKSIHTDSGFTATFGNGTVGTILAGSLAAGKTMQLVCPQTWKEAPHVTKWVGTFHTL